MSIQILNIDSGKRAVVMSEELYLRVRNMIDGVFVHGIDGGELLEELPELTEPNPYLLEIK